MTNLLLIIGGILGILWLLGLVSSNTFGGAIHVLLIIGVILFIIWLVNTLMRSRG